MKKGSFAVMMRRTNPGGTRDLFMHKDISFSAKNSYAMDFGEWDRVGDICFYSAGDGETAENKQCTKLRNDNATR